MRILYPVDSEVANGLREGGRIANLMQMKITEMKHHVDGRVSTFDCEAISLNNDSVVVNFVWLRDEPLQDGPLFFPSGEIHTRGYFWSDRNYLIYTITMPDGELLGHRIDICENVEIDVERGIVSYDDLVLDFWIDLDDAIHVLDQDELDELRDRGLLKAQQLERIERTKDHLIDNYLEIIESLNS